jgi:WD40 repeat protein
MLSVDGVPCLTLFVLLIFLQVTRLCALSDGRRVLSSGDGDSLRVWDVETGRECEERSTRGISDLFLDGHALSADLFLDLPFSQVWAAHSLVVICHKIDD